METGNNEGKKVIRRFPEWIKVRMKAGDTTSPRVRKILEDLNLATVCDGAHCPNRSECFSCGTATFLIMGKTCTRNCRFCAISPANPGPLRPDEPAAVATAAREMQLKYVVITSVTRDDLPDGGAEHFAQTIRAVRAALPSAGIEVLTPDFKGRHASIETVMDAQPSVFNHNVETAPRLIRRYGPQANYRQSLDVLAYAKKITRDKNLHILTKSGLMVGLGETDDEVKDVIRDLQNVGCDILTVGQYLAPSDAHVPVARFVHPDVFKEWETFAKGLGFSAVACGPFVRSSYHAKTVFENSEG